MEYVTFGNTGRWVSRIGFGGAPAGLKNYLEPFDPQDQKSQSDIIAAVDRALESGINYYDTAPGYGNGQSEEVLGKALEGVQSSGSHPLFIATKVMASDPNRVRASLESSLIRLKRDSVDLLQIHGTSYTQQQVNKILDQGGMAEQLQQFKREGLVKHIGFTSEDNNEAVFQFIRSGIFDTVQLCYNFIFQHGYEPSRPFGSLLEAKRAGMGTVTMRTLTSGTFQRWIQQVNPQNIFDYTPALLQFVLSNPLVDVALVGMRDPETVDRNVAISNNLNGRIHLDVLHERYV